MTPERIELVKKAARRIVELAKMEDNSKYKMKNILNEKAIHNAFVVDMAMGGSSNTVLHLLAIARESDIEYKIENINKIADKVAHISKISPSRTDVHMDDVNNAGGVNAVMCEVSKRGDNLHLDALMISGETLAERIEGCEIKDEDIIHKNENAYSQVGGLSILFGILAFRSSQD